MKDIIIKIFSILENLFNGVNDTINKVVGEANRGVKKFFILLAILFALVLVEKFLLTTFSAMTMFGFILLIIVIGFLSTRQSLALKAVGSIFLILGIFSAVNVYGPGMYDTGMSWWHGLNNDSFKKYRPHVQAEKLVQEDFKSEEQLLNDSVQALLKDGNRKAAMELIEKSVKSKDSIVAWSDSLFHKKEQTEQKDPTVKNISNNTEDQEEFDNTNAGIQVLGPNKIKAYISPKCCLNTTLLKTPGCTIRYTEATDRFRVKGKSQPYWFVVGDMDFEYPLNAEPERLKVYGDRIHYVEVIIEIIPLPKNKKKQS